jgi:hypothetical protein
MKPTAAEKARRVEEVKQALIQGLPRYAIVENLRTRYSVGRATVDNYIRAARIALERDLAEARPYLLGEHIAHRRDLRLRFRKAGDLHGELKAAIDEAKILGLYEDRLRLVGWQDEIIALIKDGRITTDDARQELGDELATELFERAGLPAVAS